MRGGGVKGRSERVELVDDFGLEAANHLADQRTLDLAGLNFNLGKGQEREG